MAGCRRSSRRAGPPRRVGDGGRRRNRSPVRGVAGPCSTGRGTDRGLAAGAAGRLGHSAAAVDAAGRGGRSSSGKRCGPWRRSGTCGTAAAGGGCGRCDLDGPGLRTGAALCRALADRRARRHPRRPACRARHLQRCPAGAGRAVSGPPAAGGGAGPPRHRVAARSAGRPGRGTAAAAHHAPDPSDVRGQPVPRRRDRAGRAPPWTGRPRGGGPAAAAPADGEHRGTARRPDPGRPPGAHHGGRGVCSHQHAGQRCARRGVRRRPGRCGGGRDDRGRWHLRAVRPPPAALRRRRRGPGCRPARGAPPSRADRRGPRRAGGASGRQCQRLRRVHRPRRRAGR